MENKRLNIEPAYIANSAGNLLNCNLAGLTGPVGFTMTQPYLLVTHVRVFNSDSVARTFSLYKGATGGSTGGTECMFPPACSVQPNAWVEWYGEMLFDAADFLSGVASVASKLTINIEAEIGVSG